MPKWVLLHFTGAATQDQVRPDLTSLRPALQQVTPSHGKHPAEAPPAAQPGAKKSKRDKDEAEEEYDVLKVPCNSARRSLRGLSDLSDLVRDMAGRLQDSGINLEEEQSALLGTLERGVKTAPVPLPAATPEEEFLNQAPLGVKVGTTLPAV